MDLGVCFFLPEVHQVDLECRHCCIYRISQILVVTVEYLDLHVGCTIRPLEQLLGCFRQINCTLQGTGLQSVLNSNCIAQVVTISGALTRSYCQFIQSPNHLLGYRLFCCGSGCSCGCSSCSSCGCNDASFCSGCSSCSSCSCSSCSSCGCSGGSCGGSFCSCGSSSGCGFFGSGSCVSCSGFCINVYLVCTCYVIYAGVDIVVFSITIVKTLNLNRCQVALTIIAVADVYAVFHPVYRELVVRTVFIRLQFQIVCFCNRLYSCQISNVHGECCQCFAGNNAHAAVGAHGEYQTTSFAVFLCIHHGLAQCRICIADLEAVGDLLVRTRNRQDLAGCFRNDHRTNDTSGADTICLCYFQLNLLVARFASYFADLPSEFIALVIGGNSSCSGCCSSGAVFSGCGFCSSGGGICYSTVANYDLYDCLGRILRQRVSSCILLTLNCSGHIFQRAYCCTIVFLICLYAVEISSGRHRDQILVCIAAADLYIIGAFCGILRNNNIEGSETQVSRLSTNKVCTVIRRSSNEAPGIVVVDVRNAVISLIVLYETSGGIARQIYCNGLFNIVCSNFPARIDVGIFDVRCTVFLLLDIAFLYLMGLVSSLICILVCQIIVCICIVVVFELDLVVAVGDQIGTKDLVTSNFSDYAVTLSVVVSPGVQVFILFEHRGHAECTAIRSAYDCAQTVRHSDIMLVDLGRCVENVLIVDTVCNCTAICEGSVLGCNPVQLYRAQVVVIRPFFRIDENVQSLGNITSSDLVLRDADGLYAASLLLEEEIVRCAAIFGLFCGNRSRNRQCTERQCRNCHQSCNAEGQNLLCSFLHVFLSFPCRYCRQIRK